MTGDDGDGFVHLLEHVNDAGQLLSELHDEGLLGDLSVEYEYDSALRRSALDLVQYPVPPLSLCAVAYTYDSTGRLHSVTDNSTTTARTATYTYVANSPLVSQIAFASGSQGVMTTTKSYDYLNRLTSINSAIGSSAIGYSYTYNAANQATRATLADGTSWAYGYDHLGQVTSGRRSWQDGTPVAGQQFEYAFDDLGNRTGAAVGGDQRGAGLRFALYSPNHLNQYESRTVPGTVDITGIANPAAAVTVNGSNAVRQGEYFWQPVTVNNTNAAQYLTNIVASTYGSGQSATGAVFIARTPEAFSYDPDGNLTNDGRWSYTWDGENRLASMTANTSVGPQQRVVFQYDWQGHRIHKQVWPNTAGTGTPTIDELFIYDGWNLLAILTSNSSLLTSFTWGLDLSGSMQGAGGVGGLLFVDNWQSPIGCHAVAYDGNGNVAALANASNSSLSARYEYGPFGELLRATGPMAKANPFRFSTKYQDDESELLYYGFRCYNHNLGCWTSRDPSGEQESPNLAAFCKNDPVGHFDRLGLQTDGFDLASGLFTATGGEPTTSMMEHESYLTFVVTCPKCSHFVFDHVDYRGVVPGLLAAGFTASQISQATPLAAC